MSSADIVDQVSSYTDKSVEMKALNRSRKLIFKINLLQISDGTYGPGKETGEPIGLKRLIDQLQLSIEAQERHMKEMKKYLLTIRL